MYDERPCPSKQDPGIVGIHGNFKNTRILVKEEDLFPIFTAIFGAVDTSFFLGTIAVSQRSYKHDVRIVSIDRYTPDPAGFIQTHMFPGLAGIGGAVDTVPDRDVAADKSLSRPSPDNIRIGGSNGQSPDRLGFLIVKDREPIGPAIYGFPNPS